MNSLNFLLPKLIDLLADLPNFSPANFSSFTLNVRKCLSSVILTDPNSTMDTPNGILTVVLECSKYQLNSTLHFYAVFY